MSKAKTYSQIFPVDVDGIEVSVDCEYTYTPGSPAVYYQRNGDPGWPAEGPELEIVEMKVGEVPVPIWFFNAVVDGEKAHDYLIEHHEREGEDDRE
jgi:hypothetical protein